MLCSYMDSSSYILTVYVKLYEKYTASCIRLKDDDTTSFHASV